MRLIDIENFKPHPKYINEMNNAILAQVFRQPIVDAEPVVRCKDCKLWDDDPDSYGKDDGPTGMCKRFF